MGLNGVLTVVLFLLLVSCVSKAVINPVNREQYIDCCDPGLSADDKAICKDAAKDEDHIVWDGYGNKYVCIWSDCEIGKEPWRKYE